MADSWCAIQLLREASAIFDNADNRLAASAPKAGNTFFASGAYWMRQALESMRGESLAGSSFNFNKLGFIKYGLASCGALLFLGLAIFNSPWYILGIVPTFYALEAQFVFLFPLALDGSRHPFRDARKWTRNAGGTLRVMGVVLPLAAVMLFGGLLGRGFVRCWCLGCLSICLWYEALRKSKLQLAAAR